MRPDNKRRITVLTLVVALFVAGCATGKAYRQRQARAKRDTGERYLAMGETNKALEQFLEAVEIYHDDHILHYLMALAYVDKQRYDLAKSHLKEAIKLKPDYSQAHNYLGVLYFRKGEVDKAIESYRKALENILYLNPQHAYLNLGVAYLSRKQYQKAAMNLERAVELVPDYVDAYNNLGKAYEGLERYRDARRAYEKAIELNPTYADPYLNLGKLLYHIGERQKAIESFDKVIRLEPSSDRAREAMRYLRALEQ